ncbi:MAG: DUF427 domain-containing protein [Actinobacteria bacterium]|nr:DUF427 domain-containing protein [Actinomycetota bacterium]
MTESVWDYPRPPRVEATARRIRVVLGDVTVADTTRAFRVLETSHPPGYYIPPEDVRSEYLRPSRRTSYCEFKGRASYYDLVVGEREVRDAAWYYPDPAPGYKAIRDHLAFYPGRVDACFVDEERVVAQKGDFYGGWLTADIVGPFKGGPGTAGW